MIKFEHLIFDVSGTLWEDRPQVVHSNIQVGVDYGKIPRGIYLANPQACYDCFTGNLVGSAVEMFRDVLSIGGSDKELEMMYKKALAKTCIEYPSELFSGIKELFKGLSQTGIRLSVISAHPQNRLEEDLQEHGLLKYFESVLGDCHNKGGFIYDSASKSGIILENTAYIGDTVSDMVAANQAGIIPIGVSYGYQDENKVKSGNPKEIFPDVDSLTSYLLERV